MKRDIKGVNTEIYNLMRARHMPRKASVQLQNLYGHCHFVGYQIIDNKPHFESFKTDTLYLLCKETSPTEIENAINGIENVEGTAVIIQPRLNKARVKYCKKMVIENKYMTIDNRTFFLCFTNPKLPKQHYKL